MERATAKLGLRDTALLVMGGIVGSGIFMNPAVVARDAPSAVAVLGAWVLGGLVALAGGFIWAELAARRPGIGGQYGYLRDGVHPLAGFLYGWSNLLVVQTGGMAAVAVTFAIYTHATVALPWAPKITAVLTLAVLTVVNLAGVRAGGAVQSAFMVAKIVAIGALVVCGLFLAAPNPVAAETLARPTFRAFFAAMIAVMFAYGGWATATFVSGEIEDQARTLPRALLLGTIGVVALYLGVNAACLKTLGVQGLAASAAPAVDVVAKVIGSHAARVIAVVVAISAFGFLAQGMLSCPRVYYAMAKDRLFFERVGRVNPKTGVPDVAIALQGLLTIITALSGSYDELLSWVVTVDFVFLSATAATLFVFRARDPRRTAPATPLQPLTTVFFIVLCLAVVVSTFVEHPRQSCFGWLLIGAGVPVYGLWRRKTS
ncbi:MAG TPA: amino acid permease [Candidatus Polarisedimenticolaceae bacterium]|nr:amino acid permease [Candidatus Polarisedimenticolaceae bacterium]